MPDVPPAVEQEFADWLDDYMDAWEEELRDRWSSDDPAQYEFREDQHPRGQPENAGEFGPGGNSGAPSKAAPAARPTRRPRRRPTNDDDEDEKGHTGWITIGGKRQYLKDGLPATPPGDEKPAAPAVAPVKSGPKKSKAKVQLVGQMTAGESDGGKKVKAVAGKILPKAGPSEFASLIGAPDDAEVKIEVHPNKFFPVLKLTVSHPDFEAIRYIGIDGEGKRYVKNDEFWVKDSAQGKGIGAEVFTNQVDNAKEHGFAYIKCHAAKNNPREPSKPHNGYYTWPRFGYDQDIDSLEGQIRDDKFKAIKNKFPDANSVLDIMATRTVDLGPIQLPDALNKLANLDRQLGKPEKTRTSVTGAEWWQIYGTDMEEAKFDLAADSRSMKVLTAYRTAKVSKAST